MDKERIVINHLCLQEIELRECVCDDEGIIYVPFVGLSDRVHTNNNDTKLYITSVFETIDTERWNDAYEK